MAPRILCVESDLAVLESRCEALKFSGYKASAASPQLAEIVLRYRKFDLIVISNVSEFDLHRIINFSDGAGVLVLDENMMPAELLALIERRLNRQRKLSFDSRRNSKTLCPETPPKLVHSHTGEPTRTNDKSTGDAH